MAKILLFLLLISIVSQAQEWVKKDASVVNTKKHLQWEDRTEVGEKLYIWKMAKAHCSSMEFAGFSDWRLPSHSELQSLSKIDKGNALFSHLGNTLYWSNEIDAKDELNAYVVYAPNGFLSTSDKCDKNYAICVRNTK